MGDLRFEQLFGGPPAVRARAAGRVNLIGEHTDYNDGYVLPVGLPLATTAQLRAIDADRAGEVAVASGAIGGPPARYRLGAEAKRGDWLDYVQGVTRLLREEGHAIGGFQALIGSDLPMGSGLSSSAALEVALLRALREAFHLGYDDLEIARLGQRVENEFVGARVGIMDQMAASLGAPGVALFIDTRTLAYEPIPLPPDAFELLVISSGITHRLAEHGGGEDYNTRRAECEAAAAALGVASLREIEALPCPGYEDLPDKLQRRVRHVVTENARVIQARLMLQQGDAAALGRLFDASHASLRDDYQVSIPAIDRLVELAQGDPRILGARITGGGFGGSIVALAVPGSGAGAAAEIADEYSQEFGKKAEVLLPQRKLEV